MEVFILFTNLVKFVNKLLLPVCWSFILEQLLLSIYCWEVVTHWLS